MACIIMAGAKCDANAKGKPSAAATCAPNKLEPKIQIGTLSADARDRDDALIGHRGRQVSHQLHHVLGKLLGIGGEIAPQGLRGRLIGTRRAARARDRCGRETGFPGCRIAPRSPAASDWAA